MANDIDKITGFLRIGELNDIFEKHRKDEITQKVPRFNIFQLISDKYHRENLHSDIIHFFLDPTEVHYAKNKYLDIFLQYLNEVSYKERGCIKSENYKDAVVKKEFPINGGRIDILIISESEKRAIIIENKINKACDTFRQLPTYLIGLKSNDYTVDAIVYLSLDGSKYPDCKDWSKEERKEIKKLILQIAACANKKDDLCQGWLMKCMDNKSSDGMSYVLDQYINLLKELRGNIMQQELLDKFYEILLQKDNYEIACSVKLFLEKTGEVLANNIVKLYDSENIRPFQNTQVCPENLNSAVFDKWYLSDHNFCITILCSYSKYQIRFFDKEVKYETIEESLTNIIESNKFEKKEDGYYKDFAFQDQENMNTFLKNFIEQLFELDKSFKGF